SLDQRSGRTDEPNDQGRDRQTLSLRRSQSAAAASRRLRRRLQFRPTLEDAQRPHALRVHLKMLDIRPTTIQTQPAPANAGTEQLVRHGAAARSKADSTNGALWRSSWPVALAGSLSGTLLGELHARR